MQDRLTKLKDTLGKQRLDAVLISSIPNIIYHTSYTGFSKDEREAFLFITKTKQFIITDGRYSEAVSVHVPHFELIEQTVANSLDTIFKTLKKKYRIKKLGIEEDNLTVSEYKMLKKHFNSPHHYSDVTTLRSIKERDEISAIEKACQLGDKTFNYILPKIKAGITEKELAFDLEYFVKKNNAQLSFPTIVAFGKNSSIPHHQTGNQQLKHGDFVLLDFGVKIDNYCSDMTRTVFFGSANAEQKKMYQTVLEAQQKAIELLYHKFVYDTVKAKELDYAAREFIIKKGYPSIPHSLGHGIGLEVHEAPSLSPNSKDKFQFGMVFSVEPGIYIPGFGGVRIEDLVVLEKSGPRLLTHSPKTLIEL